MNKRFITISALLISTVLLLSQSKIGVLNANAAEFDNNENIFTNFFGLGGKEKFQLRIKENNDNNQDFMIKGVITASSSSSITIKNQLINIDSSVTGNVKIVGNVQIGAYAMVKGIIQNSNYYANKIVVDQRNKKELEEKNENDENEEDEISVTPTVTPTVTATPSVSPTPTPEATSSALILGGESEEGGVKLNMKTLLEAIHNLLTSFRQFMLSV